MSEDRSALLFCPPLAPVPVSAERSVSIGRQGACELAIRQEDISRRHSEVCFEDGRFMLRDLGSTNGTFLNGEEVCGAAPLSPGDRIELGSATVTFCLLDSSNVEGSGIDPDGEKTVIAQRMPTTRMEAFNGDLAEIPPFAVMQVLEMGSKSGILELRGEDVCCQIWFRGGKPIHSETEKLVGFDAALSVVNLEVGTFRFEPGEVNHVATIQCSVTELLLEGCRQSDESLRD